MKTKISEKILRYHHLYDVMESYLDEWSKIEQFKTSYDGFVRNLKKLKKLNIIASKDLSTAWVKLKNLKNDLCDCLIPVSSLVELYALDENKKNLTKKINKLTDNLEKLSGKILVRNVNELCDYAEKKLTGKTDKQKKEKTLGEYGLTPVMIEKLRSASLDFMEYWEELTADRKEIKKAEKEIRKIFTNNDLIIKRRLNKFMSAFRNSDPEFYNDFIDALKKVKQKTPELSNAEPTEENS